MPDRRTVALRWVRVACIWLTLALLFTVIAGVIPSVRDTTGHQYSHNEP